jgi:hypothetical protein
LDLKEIIGFVVVCSEPVMEVLLAHLPSLYHSLLYAIQSGEVTAGVKADATDNRGEVGGVGSDLSPLLGELHTEVRPRRVEFYLDCVIVTGHYG